MPAKALQASDFVHLHNHTQYSLLDGLTKIPELIDGVRQMSMTGIAITDHGTMSGVIEFYKTALDQDIKPILGMETYVAQREHTDKDPSKDKSPFHLILLAMNDKGYRNLMRLSTIANLEGFYYRPRIDHILLEKYNEGLIVLSGCIGGEIGDAIRQGQYEKAKQIALWYKAVFGDRYYLEIQDHGHPKHPSHWQEQLTVNQEVFRLGKELDIPCVLTSDAHYLKHEDQEAHEILLCVQTGSFLTDTKRMSLKNFELHVANPKDLIGRWGDEHPEVITNTKIIADRCHVQIQLGEILIPKFPVPKSETEESYLEKLVYRGLAWRYGNQDESGIDKLSVAEAKKLLPEDAKERVRYELDVIKQMNFNGYFLIISDFVNWAKDQGIVFGPGRGSAAGSIVSYALKITELDPLKYDLLFERFLNPDRISMPDIDIDIQDSRRDEVIQYCVDKYGTNRVANIVTFGRMAARNAVRDVARVLQVPYSTADRLAKMIPPPVQGRHIPLESSLSADADLKAEYAGSEESRRVFDLAVQLEGTIRSHGVHAAGVVIAPDDIVKFAPLEMAQKGVIATQYSMGPIEDVGLLKIDFLGLSNLTIIKNALRIIKKVEDVDIDLATLPLDDAKTFELFQRGDTTGVFQFESSGMKRYLKELRPSIFDDIIAMVALYRPGPLTAGLTQRFIDRKNGKEPISFDHETMKSALGGTYGVLVYQEQVMQIAKDMCGFSGGEADTLRKAVGKKIRAMMAKMKDKIIEGAMKNGVDKKIAEKFWRDLEGFADYAFNKSHAACYALIAYQTAYLKANYPTAFMAALMTSDYDNTDRLAIEINECEHMGIKVLPPDVNESFIEFGIVPGQENIRFGLKAIKNVGGGAVEEILRTREADGPFASLEDFFGRVNTRLANRKTIESLMKAGAFDRFGERSLLINNIENLLALSSRMQKQLDSGQTDLFGNDDDQTGNTRPKLTLNTTGPDYPLRQQLQWERELLGVYLSQHPLEDYTSALKSLATPVKSALKLKDGSKASIGGMIASLREITTKNGQKMAFVQFADDADSMELVLFPKIFELTRNLWQADKVILATGKISHRGQNGTSLDEAKLIVDEAKELEVNSTNTTTDIDGPGSMQTADDNSDNESTAQSRLYIRLPNGEDHGVLTSIKQTIDEHQGDTEVVLVLGKDDSKQIIKLPMKINSDQQSLDRLSTLVGADNVKFQ